MSNSSIERRRVKLPTGFDPRRHLRGVLAKVAETYGAGWEVESMSNDEGQLTLTRFAEVTETTPGRHGAKSKVLNLAHGTKPSDGERIAARFEDAHPGYRLTKFDPFLGQATMTMLSDDEIRCRGAVATALGVKPWDIQVAQASDKSFDVELPKSYSPSKHYGKLVEVAEQVIGAPGWYVRASAAELTAQIVPGDLPMFAPAYPYPVKSKIDMLNLPIGRTLPEPGGKAQVLGVDLNDNVGVLIQGLAGSGKTVTISGFIFGALISGHQVAVIDVAHKKADFEWMKPFVRENGWGCDSLEQALTVATLVYEVGQRRGELFDEHGVKKWQDLPAKVRAQNPILTLIVDELSALLIKDTIPRSLPKDHPMRIEAEEKAAARDMLAIVLTKLPAEMRAAGIRLLYASQQAQSNTGIPPAIKINHPNRILLGAGPSKQQRGHAFANPEKAPHVPEYIAEDAKASRGVGVAEFEGQPSVVFKSYFAAEPDLVTALRAAGVPTATRPEPTPAQIDRIVPRLDEGEDDEPPASRLSVEGGWGEPDGRDAPVPRLRGAAAAAHASKQISEGVGG